MVWIRAVLLVLLLPGAGLAQEGASSAGGVHNRRPAAQSGEMEQTKMDEHGAMKMQPGTFIEETIHHGSAGTSAEPNSTPVPMLNPTAITRAGFRRSTTTS